MMTFIFLSKVQIAIAFIYLVSFPLSSANRTPIWETSVVCEDRTYALPA